MVERKKTGLAKARKRVSRFLNFEPCSILAFNLFTFSSMRGSSGRNPYSYDHSMLCTMHYIMLYRGLSKPLKLVSQVLESNRIARATSAGLNANFKSERHDQRRRGLH